MEIFSNLPFFKQLFQMKYVDRVLDDFVIAKKLGVSPKQVKIGGLVLEKYLRSKLGVITPERLEFVCPECLGTRLVFSEGEKVCSNCGFVIHEKMSIPIFGANYDLTSDLSFGKSLGGTLNGNSLMRVLVKSANGSTDLGVRAIHMRVVTEVSENPQLIYALRLGKKLIERYSFDEVMWCKFGENIRRAFGLVQMLNIDIQIPTLVETVFWFVVSLFEKQGLVKKEDLRIEPKLLLILGRFNVMLRRWSELFSRVDAVPVVQKLVS